MLSLELLYECRRAISRAVIDDDYLALPPRLSQGTLYGTFNGLLSVVAGDCDGKTRTDSVQFRRSGH
jgi:hypothetical protein